MSASLMLGLNEPIRSEVIHSGRKRAKVAASTPTLHAAWFDLLPRIPA